MKFQSKSSLDVQWITILKGFAICGIVIYHWLQFSRQPMANYISKVGGQGVYIFFILSAFGLTLSALKNKPVWSHWFKRRLAKILIPYYVAFLLLVINISFIGVFISNIPFVFKQFGFSWGGVFATIFLYRGFVGKYVYTINGALWFIITILQLYILFPFLLLMRKKFGNRKFLVISLAITLVYQFIYSGILGSKSLVFPRLSLTFIFVYALGIVFGEVYLKSKEKFNALFRNKTVIILAVVCEIVGAYLGLKGGVGLIYNDNLNAVGSFILLYNFSIILRPFLIRLFSLIGEYSYEIFLMHVPFIVLFPLTSLRLAILWCPVYLVLVSVLSIILKSILNKIEFKF